MSQELLFLATAALVFGVGMYGLLVVRHVVRQLIAVNLMSNAVFLMLITLAGGADGRPDPVPQAMVLTGIVVAVSATAFALALLVRLRRETGRSDIAEDRAGDGD